MGFNHRVYFAYVEPERQFGVADGTGEIEWFSDVSRAQFEYEKLESAGYSPKKVGKW